ncbi:hypothetical protein ABENE_03930 [Asticcacaulis benevestitus DSM 16100 = ATCC BAA-896]|uniref:Large ribosomal subunit protein bL28 n=2 Tax=Caulobacteraceae TaxID=76892 RepID=V4RRM1_9CAUL|nr:hypothetical protein ABENE_03930 [Asticcacaulis benevestitus DSM 16100 = ATCC BAA-896]
MARLGAYGKKSRFTLDLAVSFAYRTASRAMDTASFRAPLFVLTEGNPMSRRCELTGVGPMVGHSVSHSNIKTKRRFLPSLRQINLASDALGTTFRLKISNAALRTLDYKGGLDAFIVKADDADLSIRARRLKKQIKDKLAETAA